jgi:hypothetical protein
MGIFALSTLLVAGAGIYLFSKVFPNFQPGNKKVQADLQEMRADIQEEAVDLVPLGVKELELLAAEDEDRNRKKRLTTQVRGKLVTIFHEPVAVYRYKKYLSSSGKDAVLFAKTADHEYFFWIKAKGTKVIIDDSLIGTLENRSALFRGKGNDLLALIKRDAPEYMPVLIQGVEVASLTKPENKASQALSTRAFGYVREGLSREERALLMAMTIHELLMRKVEGG